MATSVFLSYSRKDEAVARQLEADLQRGRVSVWWDSELRGGDHWWQTILEQIRISDVFVFALSNNALASKPCRAELGYARDLGLPILPVQIGPVESLRTAAVGELQVVDYREQSSASGMALFAELEEAARRRSPLPDPLPVPPAVPFAYLLRLGSEIEKEALTPQEQADLVGQLRDCLETEDDESVKDDARELLRALRRRPDVTYKYAGEIDALLAGSTAPSADRSVPPPRRDTESAREEVPTSAATGSGSTRQAEAPRSQSGSPSPGYVPPGPGYAPPGGYGAPPPGRPTYPPGGAYYQPPGPSAPPPQKSRTPLLVGIGAVLATAAVAGGVLLFGQDGGDGPTPPPTTTTAPTSTTEPTPAPPTTPEDQLLAMLPLDFDTGTCSTSTLAGDGDLAAVICGESFTQPGPSASHFRLYPAGTVDSVFVKDVVGLGLGQMAAGQSCPDFLGYDSFDEGGVVKGRVACWIDPDNGSFLAWTEDEDGVEAVVSIPGGGADGVATLWTWWTDPLNSGIGS
jgi:hypothetical protein